MNARYQPMADELTEQSAQALRHHGLPRQMWEMPNGPYLHRFMTACITASIELACRELGFKYLSQADIFVSEITVLGSNPGRIFPARFNEVEAMQSVRKGWLRLCNTARITNFHPHDLRHNFTSQLQAAGVSDSIIMSITGHKTHVMLHRYSHANDEHKMNAVRSLATFEAATGGKVVRLKP